MKNNSLNNDNEDTLNEDQKFSAISKAISDGDHESLSKLMAEEPAEKDKPQDSVPEQEESEDTEVVETTTEDTDTVEDKDETDKDKKSPTEAAESAASPTKEVDELTALKEELSTLKQERHKYQSDAGRVPYMQRRLNELEREIRAYKARTPDNSTNDTTSITAADLKNVELDPETKQDIEELRAIDPVMAKTLERVAKTAVLTANRRAEQVVDTFSKHEEEVEAEKFYMEQKAELTRQIPQHEVIFSTPEWRQWKQKLSPAQRAMAESSYASDVVQAIYAFAADMQQIAPQQAAPEKQQPENANNEVKQSRDKKLGASPDIKNPAAKPTKELDEDAYFREMYKKVGKDSHIL